MKVAIVLIITQCVLASCASSKYRAFDKDYPGLGGYEDQYTSENTYKLKYSMSGDLNSSTIVKRNWRQRAEELCPPGYDYTFEKADKVGAGGLYKYTLEGIVHCHAGLD